MNYWNQQVVTLLAVVLLAGTVVLATADRSYAGILFIDDFEADSVGDILDDATNRIDKWTKLTGTASAADVTIVQDGGDPNTTKVVESNPSASNFIHFRTDPGFSNPGAGERLILKADARLYTEPGVTGGSGVISLGDDELGGANSTPSDAYQMVIFSDNTVQFQAITGNIITVLEGPSAPSIDFDAFEWHTYELRVDFGSGTDTLSMLVDSTPFYSGSITSVPLDPMIFAYLASGGGRPVRFDNVSIIPEPSVFLLGTMGLVGFLAVGRRRRK